MIYTVAEYLTALVEAITFYLLLDAFCKKRETIPRWIYYLSVILLTGLIILSNHLFSYSLLNGIGMVLSTFALSFIFRGSMPIKAILSVLGYLLASVTEVLVLFIITFAYSVSATVVIEEPSLRLLGIILSKMLAFAMVNVVCMIAKWKSIKLGKSYWIIFLLVFLNSTLAVFLLFKFAYISSISNMNFLLMICSFGLLFSAFFSFYMCERMAKQNEILNRQRQYEQQLQNQSKHLDDILVNQEALRKFRHDMRNHFTAIAKYFKENNCESGLEYMESISGVVFEDKERIKTGNTAFDAIINTKKALADSKNIGFDINVQIPEKLPIDAADICIIFGNALDNAIEACERITDGEKKISLNFVFEDNAVFCKLINTVPGENSRSFKTHKKDKLNHGLGINNIKTSLAKYNNVFNIEHDENEFVLAFIIYCD